MTRARNIGIDLAQGTTKRVNFIFEDLPDLSAAIITLTVKRHFTDQKIVISKQPDINLSPELENGKFTIKFDPVDTEQLTPRSYVYELEIVFPNGDVVKPILGDFKLYPTLS